MVRSRFVGGEDIALEVLGEMKVLLEGLKGCVCAWRGLKEMVEIDREGDGVLYP